MNKATLLIWGLPVLLLLLTGASEGQYIELRNCTDALQKDLGDTHALAEKEKHSVTCKAKENYVKCLEEKVPTVSKEGRQEAKTTLDDAKKQYESLCSAAPPLVTSLLGLLLLLPVTTCLVRRS